MSILLPQLDVRDQYSRKKNSKRKDFYRREFKADNYVGHGLKSTRRFPSLKNGAHFRWAPSVRYQPLQSPQHIRLLRISGCINSGFDEPDDAQSETTDEENYELVNIPLVDYEDAYEAISYVWGDPNRNSFIKVNGQYSLPITKTLAVALPQLARICSTRFLWIDQICINQQDNKERGQQVSIMGEIYSNAASVLIWSGGRLAGLSEIKSSSSLLGADDPFKKCHAETLTQVLFRPWFSRGWTVQEAVLARKAIFVAGPYLLPLEDLELALRNPNISYSAKQLERSRTGRYSFLVTMNLRRSREALRSEGGKTSHDPVWLRCYPRIQYPSFDTLLNGLGDTQLCDPRDHVYAFLGLKIESGIIIRPDYEISIARAFTNATRAIIQGTSTLNCLTFLPYYTPLKGLMLPSWVPDWSKRQWGANILINPDTGGAKTKSQCKADNAMGHTYRKPSTSGPSRSDILHVVGRIMDSIGLRLPNLYPHVYGTIYPQCGGPISASPRFFSLTDEQVTNIDHNALTDPTQTLRKRLVTTILSGTFDPEVTLGLYDNDTMTNASPRESDDLNLHLRQFWNHQLWLTQSGKLSLTPPTHCERGDALAIVHGSPIPLLLRRKTDGTFTVVGQCYLEDAMYGEAVTWNEDEADIFALS